MAGQLISSLFSVFSFIRQVQTYARVTEIRVVEVIERRPYKYMVLKSMGNIQQNEEGKIKFHLKIFCNPFTHSGIVFFLFCDDFVSLKTNLLM